MGQAVKERSGNVLMFLRYQAVVPRLDAIAGRGFQVEPEIRVVELGAPIQDEPGEPPEHHPHAIELLPRTLQVDAEACVNVFVEVLKELLPGFRQLAADLLLEFVTEALEGALDF